MSPIFSRSSALRGLLRGIRREKSSESVELPYDKLIEKRLKQLNNDRLVSPSFAKFIAETGIAPLDYVKELGKYDKDFLITHQEEFNHILWYFWNRTGENLYDLENVLEVLCSSFASHEKDILNSCYSAFLTKVIETNYELEILLERMADWDEISGCRYFAEMVENSITELCKVLISSSPFTDIIWTLKNRFLINIQTIDDEVYSRIREIYCESTIGDLICENALNELFKLDYGLTLFFIYSPIYMREYDDSDIIELKEFYNIDINVNITCRMT